jgi:hypothetical protein
MLYVIIKNKIRVVMTQDLTKAPKKPDHIASSQVSEPHTPSFGQSADPASNSTTNIDQLSGEDTKANGTNLNAGDASSGVWARMYQWMKDHPIATCGLGILLGAAIALPLAAPVIAPLLAVAAIGAVTGVAGYYAVKGAVALGGIAKDALSDGLQKLKNFKFRKTKEEQQNVNAPEAGQKSQKMVGNNISPKSSAGIAVPLVVESPPLVNTLTRSDIREALPVAPTSSVFKKAQNIQSKSGF